MVVVLWWGLSAAGFIPAAILASPSAVARVFGTTAGVILHQAASTAMETGAALGIAWIGGLVVGAALATVRALFPFLGLARSAYAVPFVILYPILTVWFGFGSSSKIAFGAFAGIVPMILITAAAVRTVDPKILLLFKSVGASRAQTVVGAMLPASVPGIVGALRLSGSLCLVSVVVGEMLVSTHGLGYLIANSASLFDTPSVYVGICCVIVLAVLLHAMLSVAEGAASRYGVRTGVVPGR